MRLLLAAAIVILSTIAQAQQFPTRPVTLIVPWPPGGSTDIAMRALATATEKHLGQSIVIENRPGAAGTLGPSNVAGSAKPDANAEPLATITERESSIRSLVDERKVTSSSRFNA